MSYDITLVIKTGPENKCVVDCGNYTYNVYGMYFKAMGQGLNKFNDVKCADAIPLLQKGVRAMQDDPKEYRKLNPENGWGDYDGALRYLQNLLDECVRNPLCTIVVH